MAQSCPLYSVSIVIASGLRFMPIPSRFIVMWSLI